MEKRGQQVEAMNSHLPTPPDHIDPDHEYHPDEMPNYDVPDPEYADDMDGAAEATGHGAMPMRYANGEQFVSAMFPTRPVTKASMTLREAKAIVSEMVNVHLSLMGVTKQRQVMNYELRDMLKANDMVMANNAKMKTAKGRRTLGVTLDDRAIAALYTAMNYQPSENAIALVNGKALFVENATRCTTA